VRSAGEEDATGEAVGVRRTRRDHMRIAVLSAVMTDLESQRVDEIWCGGDIAFGGAWAGECIARVREAGWTTIKGNTDIWVTGDPQPHTDPEARTFIEEMAAIHSVSEDDARWLVNLPLGHSAPGSVLLVHATPDSPFDGPLPDAPAADFAPFEGRAGLVIYGHVHQAFVRKLPDGTIVCNTGSVGMPMDGDEACYMLLDSDGPSWMIRHRRVRFDRRAVIAQLKRCPEPLRSWALEHFGEP
jgi:predicted phosphodiesterase